jgi:hypothetical protein
MAIARTKLEVQIKRVARPEPFRNGRRATCVSRNNESNSFLRDQSQREKTPSEFLGHEPPNVTQSSAMSVLLVSAADSGVM